MTYYKLYNTKKVTFVNWGTEDEFIHFAKQLAMAEPNWSVLGLSDAVEFVNSMEYLDYQYAKTEYDEDPMNPRIHCDQLGTMVCRHPRYILGDEQPNDINEWLKEKGGLKYSEYIQLPLYLYDHSGLTMRTTPFNCRWDSGQVGIIYVSLEDVRKEHDVRRVSKKLRNIVKLQLIAEVEQYNTYLTGDIHVVTIFDSKDEEMHSCGNIEGDYIIKYLKEF